MTLSPPPTCVIVPGMRDHVPEHWQTLLAHRLPGAVTVPPLTEDRLSLDAQVSALDHAVAQVSGPVVLVAHSAGVITTVHWALHHRRRVHGALLAASSDSPGPGAAASWTSARSATSTRPPGTESGRRRNR